MRNSLFNQLLPFIYFCFWQGLCFASGVPQVINFDKLAYQAHSQNWSVNQGANGYIYAGNSSGMLEYDGQHWTLFTLPQKQKVRAVVCNKDGRIFVGGYGEFGFWKEGNKGHLVYTSLSKSVEAESAKTEEIWHILIKDSLVLFQSFGTIYKYDMRTGQVVEIRPPSNILFAQLVKDRILIPGIHGLIYEWSEEKGFQVLEGLEILTDKRVSFLLPFNDGILIGTKLQGLYWYNGEQCNSFRHPLNGSFKHNEINFGKLLSNGRIVIGTILNGIYFLDEEAKLLYHLNKEKGLQNNTVLHLFEDREHNLWAGLDSGIDLLILNKNLVYFRDNTGKLGTVYAATNFKDRLYIGTNHGVFYRGMNASNEAFQLLEGSQGQVWELKVFNNQLICGHNSGTFIIQDQQFIRISEITGGWSTLELSEGCLLQGTYTGLVLFELNSANRWQFKRKISGLNEPIKKLVQEDSHTYWVLHPYRGVQRIQLDSAYTRVDYAQKFTTKDSLPTEFNLDLYKINNDIILKSDDAYFVWANQQLQSCEDIYRIPINQADDIIEGQGDDWFKTETGQLEWWDRDQLQQRIRTGIVVGGTRILPMDTHRYLMCMEDSYILLDKAQAFQPNSYPAPRIKEIQKSKYPVHAIIPNDAKDVELQPNWNNLKFTFASPVFSQKVLFRYRLKPIYAEWSNWSPTTLKEFTNLPKGSYTFELQSNVSEGYATFSFTILPKWYQTSLASIFFMASIFGLLLAFWRWHKRRMRNQQRRLEIEKERQLHQQRIQTKNERLQADLQNKRKEIANSTFTLVQKNETLIQIKERLSELKKETGNHFPESQYNSLIRLLNDQLHSRQDWDLFEHNFNEVHEDFFRRLKKQHPSLTPGDLRLAAYLRMNLSSKEIAPLLFITIRGVENKRYRLRKKINLPGDENLTEYLITF